ncbi:MAG: aryl sulfotransferase, partial [Chloroflexi bacterium]|nr:aryl sulfotransferase [Chloroflexota bacterium]
CRLSHRSIDIIAIVDSDTREIIWAWGLGVLDGQHQPQMLPNGNILLFDNGTLRGYSRVLEFDPREPDVFLWEYSDPEGFFSPFRAGQQRLPNGNTLICEADCGRIFEVTMEGDVVWDYYSPFFGDQFVNVYRATRYSPELVEPLLDEGILAHSREGRYGPWLR